NCTVPDILEFPNLFRKRGALNTTLCILMSTYLFIILAIICDDYLVPAMERLCYTLHVSYDVAGATFLAAATSSPELFVAFVGTFITKGDIGVGTIVGSSVFNMLGIASVCGILTGITLPHNPPMDWWPITRDTFWYMVSIVLLFVVLFDSKVFLYECAGMLGAYLIYVVALGCDRKFQKLFRTVDAERDMIRENPLDREESERLKSFRENICMRPDPEDNILLKIWFVIKYPAVILLALTTPSARAPYFLSMIVAVAWICVISYFVTWFITVVGYNLGIPDAIMGLTALAIGTSVPEVVSSYIVCKRGYPSMAMCNAIGSNTFDIFICLGLPWTIRVLTGAKVIINSCGLTITTGMLIVAAAVIFSCFLITKFVLGKLVGWLSLVMYILFLCIACTIEIKNLKEVCDVES
ncbi:hypothetical protein KR222_004697, partial [Zaprionus bogoriensis]